MTTKIQEKVADITRWASYAYTDTAQSNKYNALNNARKAGEAICKLIIYNELGDDLGESFINGIITVNLKIINEPSALTLNALIDSITNPKIDTQGKFQDKKLKQHLSFLRNHGNKGSHDINNISDNDIKFSEVVYCMITLSDIIKYVFSEYMNLAIPSEISDHINKNEHNYFLEQSSNLPKIKQIRKMNLEDEIIKIYDLIKSWKDQQIFNTDPTFIKKCEHEISRFTKLAEEAETEYNNLFS